MPTRPAVTDGDAVERFLTAASPESFEELFREVAPPLVSFFRVRGCDLALAEDLTQEVMLAVYRGHGDLRSKDRFRPWLYRIARNALLRHFRDAHRRIATVGLAAPGERIPEPSAEPLPLSQFADWMAWLGPEEAQIMSLRYLEGLEHHEIAEVLGIPLGTVQWKVFQATKKLAAHFGARVDKS